MIGTDDDVTAPGVEYAAVVNDEGQYSIWRADREPPAGWRPVGVRGSKQLCLEHIASEWTDLRPLSLRRRMAADGTDPEGVAP
jgi:MbtH protein